MLCTKSGYSRSVIFSLLAKSRARSKGILSVVRRAAKKNIWELFLPHALQMHRSNFHNMANLLALQDTISTTPRHSRNIEELRPINHVVI